MDTDIQFAQGVQFEGDVAVICVSCIEFFFIRCWNLGYLIL